MNRIIVAIIMMCALQQAMPRQRSSFNHDWRFLLADSAAMCQPDYNDSHWRTLSLPHDWSIEGDFFVGNPAGAGGGALPGGVAWYRKHFTVPSCNPGDRINVCFDGVYRNSTVYVNGHMVGNRPYGFISFSYDITPYVNLQGDNVIAVRVDNGDQPNCRWYSGSGIYRHTWIETTAPTHIGLWGTHVEYDFGKGKCALTVNATVNNHNQPTQATITHSLIDRDGKTVARTARKVALGTGQNATKCQFTIKNPHLWSVKSPYIYTLVTKVEQNGSLVDTYTTPVGFRTIHFDAQKGFSLNGEPMKINGVCMHSDLGCLGVAVNEDALHRQLLKLKQMGCNAVRCSHNPPAPQLLAMCDTMGLMVMDESFDVWRRRKTANDYALFFDRWAERDLTDMMLRDRNHPSIIMWSIGNEVLEQWTEASADTLSPAQANLILNAGHEVKPMEGTDTLHINSVLTRNLADIVRRYDRSRPITAGCNEPSPDNHLFRSGALDVIGFNYHHQWIADVPKNFPGKPFIITESVSALQTRDNYMMPSDSVFVAPVHWWETYTHPSMQCSAYDNFHTSWSSTHEVSLDIVDSNPFVSGQFIWTGWDYLGEPTPYDFPARSSYFGIIDLAGFPKDVYYMYQSQWTDTPVLHLFPHWNWMDGEDIDLWCYYNQADEVELLVNGKSMGAKRKEPHQYHVAWRVTYQPGEVTAIARQNGKEVRRTTLRTANQPAKVVLQPDYVGNETIFVNALITDAQGNLCPWANNNIVFSVEGGTVIATDNGLQTSMERFGDSHRHAFNGKAMVVVKPHSKGGKVTLTARSIGLESHTLQLGTAH